MTLKEINRLIAEKGFALELGPEHFDGKFHRFPSEFQKSWAKALTRTLKNGNDYYSILLGDYRNPDKFQHLKFQVTPVGESVESLNLDQLDLKTSREIKQIEKKLKAEVLTAQLGASEQAVNLWSEWSRDHLNNQVSGYGDSKQLPHIGPAIIIQNFEDNQKLLVVPMTDEFGEIWNLQTIYAKGGKQFRPKGRTDGLFHKIPGTVQPTKLLITEGYATGVAVHLGSGGLETWVAFSCGNLESVVQIALKQGHKEIIICADWDGATMKKTGENPGMLAAQKLALKYGVRVTWPLFVTDETNLDFCDLWTDGEKEAISDCIRNSKTYEYLKDYKFETPNEKVESKPKKQKPVKTMDVSMNSEPKVEEPEKNKEKIEEPAPNQTEEKDPSEKIPGEPGTLATVAPETAQPNYLALTNDMFPDTGKRGSVKTTLRNFKVLCDYIQATMRYNVITKEQEWAIPGEKASKDNYYNVLYARFIDLFARVGMDTSRLDHYLTYSCDQNQFNPVKTWIESKPWDGVSRLEDLFATVVCQNEKTDPEVLRLKKTLIRKWMLSAIEGAWNPHGVQVAGMLVMQGEQYIGKTKWMMSLAPRELDLLAESKDLDPRDKDKVKQTVRYWIVELGELDGIFKRSEVAALKAFITRGSDMFRPAYARKECNFVRRTVFFGSVNEKEFLIDPTGNRRYWTLQVESLNFEHGLDMQQVWAELRCLKSRNPGNPEWNHWLTDDEAGRLNRSNTDFELIDPLEEHLLERIDWTQHGRDMSTNQLWTALFAERPKKHDLNHLAQVVRKITKKEMRKSNGQRVLWVGKIRQNSSNQT